MQRRSIGFLTRGLVVLALTLTPLAACSSSSFVGAVGGASQTASLPTIKADNADAALAEARTHFRSSNFGYSAAFYKRAVELSPRSAEAYVGLGASYDQLRRFDLADRVYASLFKLSGGTVQYYNNVGYSYMLRGDLAAALTNFRKAEKLDPDNIVVANNMQILADAASHA